MRRFVIAATADLFFASKIRATADPLNVEVKFIRNSNAALDAAKQQVPDLIVVDLQTDYAFDLARELRKHEKLKTVPLLGFYSHVMTELQQQAREAGYDHVLPRSAFSARLSEILGGDL